MSLRTPALRHKRSATSTKNTSHLAPIATVQRERRPWRSSHTSVIPLGPELHTPEGIFVQVSGLVEAEDVQEPEVDDSGPTLFNSDVIISPVKYIDKKACQWKRWNLSYLRCWNHFLLFYVNHLLCVNYNARQQVVYVERRRLMLWVCTSNVSVDFRIRLYLSDNVFTRIGHA